jgi:hypothetical protein
VAGRGSSNSNRGLNETFGRVGEIRLKQPAGDKRYVVNEWRTHMPRNTSRALRVGSLVVAAGCTGVLASHVFAGVLAVQVLGTVLHHWLG